MFKPNNLFYEHPKVELRLYMNCFQWNYCFTHKVDFINYSALSSKLKDNVSATIDVACLL